MLKIVNCDIFNSECEVICHQVNCKGVMGSGLALQIKNRYIKVYDIYRKTVAQSISTNLLGEILPVIADNNLIIINIFGQYGYGRDKIYTNYNALYKGFKKTYCYCKENNIKTVAFPYNIGCSLGGGDWSKVYDMLLDIFKDDINITCKICKL